MTPPQFILLALAAALLELLPLRAQGFRIFKPRQALMSLLAPNGGAAEERLFMHRCFHSDPEKGHCFRALDGDAIKTWTLCTSTKSDYQPDWIGYLETPAYISRVVIHTVELPKADMIHGLSDFALSTSGTTCYRHSSAEFFQVKSFPCDTFGEEVRIKSQLTNAYLALCEVEVYGIPVTFQGLNKRPQELILDNCDQTSVASEDQTCDRAMDRDFSQIEAPGTEDGKMCAVTNPDSYTYYAVYFQSPALVTHVKLFLELSRVDEMNGNLFVKLNDSPCKADDSDDLRDANGKVVQKGDPRVDQPIFDCNSKFGSFVQVNNQKDKDGILAFCQVQVFGYNMIMASDAQFAYLGCFKDNLEDPDLDQVVSSTFMSPAKCHRICKRKSTSKFGLQNGEVCYCGNKHGKYGASDKCKTPCSVEFKQICGGRLANSVYEIIS